MRTLTPKVTAKARLKTMVRAGLSTLLAASGGDRLIGRRYGGQGVILMFHEFVSSPVDTLGQGCPVDHFDAILAALKASGRDFVGADEALRRLTDPEARPFVVLTFDDGYRSNIDLALPVMERHAAPATIFVPTGMVDRSINAWWLGLRELAVTCDVIEMEPMELRLECRDLRGKQAALELMTAWVWQDFARADLLAPVLVAHGVSMPDLVDRLALDEAGIRAADRHPLVEIGAHTATHRALRLLDDAAVETDIGDNKRYLETLLDRPVDWFAYPYGPPSIGGTREADIVRKLGFRAAVTTDPGGLFRPHLNAPYLLPRQNAEVPASPVSHALAGANGVFRALSTRFGAPYDCPGDIK
ncbi:polysaccharide deacetylase family protein [Pannonibacter carbonis]|uniref:polysaccharide deacetylase family protein n=1 Tax=Pannonibacter carbonis TaxID=2067569 RepID=UPI0018E582CF|nr:polysaccharide deacetylase family protein [Pannonibacter carbonis]